jgi:hypothetical protein
VGTPVPFRTKKGEEFSPWKAVVNGKIIELAPSSATQEEASTKLEPLLPSLPTVEKKKMPSLGDLFKKSETTPLAEPSLSTDSKGSASPTKSDDKDPTGRPKTGELRKNGLSDLAPAKLKAFREQIAFALSSGNVSLDRALVSIFRDKVPFLAPEQHLLLSTGWELACEQYFVNGVPPAWIIILLGNAMVCTSLYEKSEPKKEEEPPKHDGTIAVRDSGNRPQANI